MARSTPMGGAHAPRKVKPYGQQHPGHAGRVRLGDAGTLGGLAQHQCRHVGGHRHPRRDQAHGHVDEALLAEPRGCVLRAAEGLEPEVRVGDGTRLPGAQRLDEAVDPVTERVGRRGVEVDVEHRAAVLHHRQAHGAGDGAERPLAGHVGPVQLVEGMGLARRRAGPGLAGLVRGRRSSVRGHAGRVPVDQGEGQVLVEQRDAERDAVRHRAHGPALDHPQQALHVIDGRRHVLVQRLPTLRQQLHDDPLDTSVLPEPLMLLRRQRPHHTRAGGGAWRPVPRGTTLP